MTYLNFRTIRPVLSEIPQKNFLSGRIIIRIIIIIIIIIKIKTKEKSGEIA